MARVSKNWYHQRKLKRDKQFNLDHELSLKPWEHTVFGFQCKSQNSWAWCLDGVRSVDFWKDIVIIPCHRPLRLKAQGKETRLTNTSSPLVPNNSRQRFQWMDMMIIHTLSQKEKKTLELIILYILYLFQATVIRNKLIQCFPYNWFETFWPFHTSWRQCPIT